MLRSAVGQRGEDIASIAAQPDLLDYSKQAMSSGVSTLGNEVSRGRLLTGFEMAPKKVDVAAVHPPPVTITPTVSATTPATGVGPSIAQIPTAPVDTASLSVTGPGRPLANRFVPIERNVAGQVIGGQINPEQPGIVAEARRAGTGIESTGGVSGGNVSQFQMSPDQQAEVAARKAENSRQLIESNTNMDEINLMAGAHGPKEARSIANVLFPREIARKKADVEARTAKTLQIKDMAEANLYQEHAKYYAAQALAKDPTITTDELAKQSGDAAMLEAFKTKSPEEAIMIGQSVHDAIINSRAGKKFVPGSPAVKTGIFGGPDVPATSPGWVGEPAQADLEHTAQKYGISVDEVKKRLGSK